MLQPINNKDASADIANPEFGAAPPMAMGTMLPSDMSQRRQVSRNPTGMANTNAPGFTPSIQDTFLGENPIQHNDHAHGQYPLQRSFAPTPAVARMNNFGSNSNGTEYSVNINITNNAPQLSAQYPAPTLHTPPTAFNNSIPRRGMTEGVNDYGRYSLPGDVVPRPVQGFEGTSNHQIINLPSRPPRLLPPAQQGGSTPMHNGGTYPLNNTQLPSRHDSTQPSVMFTNRPPTPAKNRLTLSSSVNTRAQNISEKYGNQIRNEPPHNIEPPRNIDISMLEILTFFPGWFKIPEVAMRAQANDWDRKAVAKAELNAIGLLDNIYTEDFAQAMARIQKQFSLEGKALFDLPDDTKWSKSIIENRNHRGNKELTAVNWRLKSEYQGGKRKEEWGSYPLKAICDRVEDAAKWPQGSDRLVLTRCLEFARSRPDLDLDTSHFGRIMQTQGIFPTGPKLNDQHNKLAVKRFEGLVPDPPKNRRPVAAATATVVAATTTAPT